MILFWDLDGTLTDAEPFVHLIHTKPKNWAAWDQNIINHEPHTDIVSLYMLHGCLGHHNYVVTARSEAVREGTTGWLKKHGLWEFCKELVMRPAKDYRPDHEVKLDILNMMRSNNINPDIVFEDRSRVVQMYRENGVRCLQVANGDY